MVQMKLVVRCMSPSSKFQHPTEEEEAEKKRE